MSRLIYADELRNEMHEYVFPITTNNLMGAADAYYRILHLLDDAQTVDAVEVVHGEWIPEDVAYNGKTEKFKCSACGRVHFYGHYVRSLEYEFCPMCGAMMNGGTK